MQTLHHILAGRRVAVIGAGPIGLEAALYAATLGASVRVYERGTIAASVGDWGHIPLFTAFGLNHTVLGRRTLEAAGRSLPDDDASLTGEQWRAAYLLPLAVTPPLEGSILEGSPLVTVGRGELLKGDHIGDGGRSSQPFRLLVRSPAGERYDQADVVLDCSGTYMNPNWLGLGGVPALGEAAARPHIDYHPIDVAGTERGRFVGRRVLLVGGGYSAATTAVALAGLALEDARTEVLWVTRVPREVPITPIEADALPRRAELAAAANRLASDPAGQLTWLAGGGITAIEWLPDADAFEVDLQTAAATKRVTVDRVIANVGYEPDDALYRGLQIHECYASRGPMKLAAALLSATAAAGGDCMKVGGLGPEALANPEPDFFILGAKSYGRNSLFLLGNGHEQVRDVFRLITGDRELDLYAAAGEALLAYPDG